MDNLSEWGHGEIKAWTAQAAQLIQLKGKSCQQNEVHYRAAVQNKLAGICEEMCKEVGAYPQCTCPGFTAPDATPGVMTWDELLEHMDNLVEWGAGEIKGWKSQAAGFIQQQQQSEACMGEDLKHRILLQNKLAG